MNRKDFSSDNITQNRTSFLIEDILYRQKNGDHPRSDSSAFFSTHLNNNNSKVPLEPPSRAFHSPQKHHQESGCNKDFGAQGFFQGNLVQTGGVPGFQTPDNGYIQVMGALGAYLGTPYKNIGDPYFLTQGILNLIKISFSELSFLKNYKKSV